MRSARALLWEAHVTRVTEGAASYLSWEIAVLDEAAAQNWLPITRTEGNRFTEDFYAVRSPEVKRATDAAAKRALEAGATSYQQEFPIPLTDGTLRWLREDVQVQPLGPECWELVGVCVDVTERHRSEEALLHRAHHDELTGLPNRLTLLQLLDTLLATDQPSPVLLFLDLDNFKEVNDTLGHLVGDRVLKAVAERLRRALPEPIALMRLGGDEFTAVLPGGTSAEETTLLVQRLQEALRMPLLMERRTFILTASVGIAMGPTPSSTELLRQADTAMYHAKRQHSGGFAFYTPPLERRTFSRLELEQELRHALECGQIAPYFQPIVELASGRPQQLEALARWQHPERGLISPGEFIPLAEETGLILPLGEHLLRIACESAQGWRRHGLPVGVSLNVSAFQLRSPQFLERLQQILAETELEPSTLTLEISENTLMSDVEHHRVFLSALTSLGVHAVIDDFGSGFSSLAYLSQLPLDGFKLDRRFLVQLQNPDDAPAAKQLLRTAVALAQVQERSLTAVGIETDTQLSVVKRLGLTHGQGFYLARPLSVVETQRFLQARAPRTRRAA